MKLLGCSKKNGKILTISYNPTHTKIADLYPDMWEMIILVSDFTLATRDEPELLNIDLHTKSNSLSVKSDIFGQIRTC